MLNKHLLEILQSKIAVLRLELVLMIKSLLRRHAVILRHCIQIFKGANFLNGDYW